MSVNWTREQRQAIEAQNGTVLVSAAAGSGKTAVLVERVISRLTQSERPCSTDRLLIVTFTKAATAQMRERISAAILKRLAAEPSNSHLRRQYMLLPFAQICTIDSFCNDLVRENFHTLNISPDYSVLDNETALVLRREAVQRVLERAYGSGREDFFALSDLVSSGDSDDYLASLLTDMHNISNAYPFPGKWLDSLELEYSRQDISSSAWGGIIISHLDDMLAYCISESEALLGRMEQDEQVQKAYAPAVEADLGLYSSLRDSLLQDWDSAVSSISNCSFARLGSLPRGYDSEIKNLVKTVRDRLKKLVKKAGEAMCVTSAQHSEDVRLLGRPVSVLVNLVKEFSDEYALMKREINSVDFSDILHLALNLLVEPVGDGFKKTGLAQELSGRYDEILVDEYQDINRAQDMIFRAVSKDESNLFMVGDVKQSIYRFRQAMPEIFLRRRASMEPFSGENYPARITLDKNFRSRSGVTAAVNYMFRQLMSESAGEINYDDSESLCAAAAFAPRDREDVQLHIVDACDGRDVVQAQAQYAARYIKNAVAGGLTVTRGGELVPARYGDFCILLRSAKNTASVFVHELERVGVPVFSPSTGGFFKAAEISFVLSLLRVLDNPMQDISLAAVMLSPVFGFCADDLARLRLEDRQGSGQEDGQGSAGRASLYRSVSAAAARGDARAKDFLSRLDGLRRLSLTLSAGELVRRVVEQTGYMAIAGAMPDGERRRLNLGLLADYANRYEAAGNIGLSGFIRFIDKIARSDADLATAARPSQEADVVRVMTVHQSKGLEFPVCILADMQRRFNERDSSRPVIVNSVAGIGMKRRAQHGMSLYDTAPRRAAKIMSERMGRSEEMRVLYVALTRAKESLIMLTALKNPQKKLMSLAAAAGTGEQLNPFAVLSMTSFSDWVLTSLLRHPDAAQLRELAGVGSTARFSKKDVFKLKVAVECPQEETQQGTERITCAGAPAHLVEQIAQRLDFVCARAPLARVPAKRAASDNSPSGINREFFASARPAFLSSGGLTAAQRGTATHKFMQFANYASAKQNSAAERQRLVDMGFLSPSEGRAVDLKAVDRFFACGLADRIFASQNVMREKKFTVLLPASVFHPELEPQLGEEQTVVQGIADCAFTEGDGLVVVDYKTDSGVTAEQLLERYTPQLSVYRRALSECLGMPVLRTLIYSFSLGACIEVADE